MDGLPKGRLPQPGVSTNPFSSTPLSVARISDFHADLPRIIGVMLGIEGLCYLANRFANFLAPGIAVHFFPDLVASAVAEISVCLWLLVIGVNVQRWREQASAAGVRA